HQDTQENRSHHEKRCQLGVDEGGGDPTGDTKARGVDHLPAFWIATRLPSASKDGGVTISFSPAVRPDKISNQSPRASPSVTKRSRAISPSTTCTDRTWPRLRTAD